MSSIIIKVLLSFFFENFCYFKIYIHNVLKGLFLYSLYFYIHFFIVYLVNVINTYECFYIDFNDSHYRLSIMSSIQITETKKFSFLDLVKSANSGEAKKNLAKVNEQGSGTYYIVESIISHKKLYNVKGYNVKWVGYE